MKSCCRRQVPLASPRDFCGSLALSTPVNVRAEGGKLTAYVRTPGGETMELQAALTHFKCRPASTTGIMLASMVVRGLAKAAAAGRQGNVTTDRNIPLLTLKDQLWRIVQVCVQCHGAGLVQDAPCTACGGSGFRQ